MIKNDGTKYTLQEEANLKRFIHPHGMDIRALGERTLGKLVSRGFVSKPQDLYNLNIDAILRRNLVNARQLDKIYYAILKTSSRPLKNVLYAFNIPNVGLDHAETIAIHYRTLRAFMYDSDELYNIEDLPNNVKDSVAEWLGEMSNQELMAYLLSRHVGTLPYEDPRKGKPLEGQRWYFTITDKRTLALRKTINDLGGRISEVLSKRDTFAVAVKTLTPKQIESCENYGVTILTLAQASDRIKRHVDSVNSRITDPFIKHIRGID